MEGRRELVAFAKEHGVKHDICGKLIVATDKEELPRLEKIYNTGVANGIEGMERITAEQIKEIEPFCEGIAGVRVGCTGIIDFRGATNKMAEVACGRATPEQGPSRRGVHRASTRAMDTATVRTSKGTYTCPLHDLLRRPAERSPREGRRGRGEGTHRGLPR